MNLETEYKRKRMFPVISMADIVLLLLIFFLLTSSYLVQPGIKVKLPRATSKEALSRERISITITKAGGVYLEDRLIDISRLPHLLKDVGDRVVLIKADREVTIDMTVRVMDVVRRSGVKRFVIATTPGAG